MTFAESQLLPFGLYRLHWFDGGSSLASVGGLCDGRRWFAPTNWTNESERGVTSTNWLMVERAECIVRHGDKTATAETSR